MDMTALMEGIWRLISARVLRRRVYVGLEQRVHQGAHVHVRYGDQAVCSVPEIHADGDVHPPRAALEQDTKWCNFQLAILTEGGAGLNS